MVIDCSWRQSEICDDELTTLVKTDLEETSDQTQSAIDNHEGVIIGGWQKAMLTLLIMLWCARDQSYYRYQRRWLGR